MIAPILQVQRSIFCASKLIPNFDGLLRQFIDQKEYWIGYVGSATLGELVNINLLGTKHSAYCITNIAYVNVSWYVKLTHRC